MDDAFAVMTGLPVMVAENPLIFVALRASKALENASCSGVLTAAELNTLAQSEQRQHSCRVPDCLLEIGDSHPDQTNALLGRQHCPDQSETRGAQGLL